MKVSRVVQELSAIALLSAGSGVLLVPLLEPLSSLQRFGVLGGALVMVISRTLKDKTRQVATSGKRHFMTQVTNTGWGMAKGNNSGEMKRYFAWIEKKLQALIVREGLQCALVKMKRGPLVITLHLRLIQPTQRDLQKLLRLGPTIAQLLQVESVRVSDTAQGILIEVPSPAPLTPNGVLLARYTKGFTIAIGVDSATKPVLVELEDHGALFWVGPSRRGKTQSMKSALYALLHANPSRVQFVIFSTPAKVQEDWGVYEQIAGCLGIASTKEEIAIATAWLTTVMNLGEVKARGVHIVAIYDDLPKILKAIPDLSDDISDLSSLGAGLGVHLWAGTQGAGSKRTSGGADVESNVTARILYRPATSRLGSQSAGTGGLDLDQLSSQRGDALALIHGVVTRVATAWIADRDILLLPARTTQASPWNHREPGQNQSHGTRISSDDLENHLKPARTTQNQSEPPLTWSENGSFQGEFDDIDINAPKPVLEPPLQIESIDGYLHYLAGLTNDELRQRNLGIDSSRFPTSDEQRMIAVAFAITNSLNKTCRICYGYKNPKVDGYIKAVVSGAVGEMTRREDDGE